MSSDKFAVLLGLASPELESFLSLPGSAAYLDFVLDLRHKTSDENFGSRSVNSATTTRYLSCETYWKKNDDSEKGSDTFVIKFGVDRTENKLRKDSPIRVSLRIFSTRISRAV